MVVVYWCYLGGERMVVWGRDVAGGGLGLKF